MKQIPDTDQSWFYNEDKIKKKKKKKIRSDAFATSRDRLIYVERTNQVKSRTESNLKRVVNVIVGRFFKRDYVYAQTQTREK